MSISVSETRRFAEGAKLAGRPTKRLRERVTRATGLTSAGLSLLGVAGGSWGIAWFAGGRMLYMLSYGSLLVLAVSWTYGRRPLQVDGDRAEPRPRAAQGEVLEMEVRVRARRRLSTFVLEDHVPPFLGQPARMPVAALESGDEVEHGYKLACWRRGAYRVGPLVARWGDPFGLTQREMTLQDECELLVHPSTEPVTDRPLTRLFEDPPMRPKVSKPWPTGLEFYGMKEYAPGDDLRRIVWRAYARTGQLLVRESEQGITDKITIVLDQDARHHSTGLVSDSFETGVRAAASLGTAHLREGYSVTLEGSARRLAGPLRGFNAQMELLDALARVDMGEESITSAIMRLVADATRNTHMVLLTPRLDVEATARLQILLRRGVSILVAALIHDEDSSGTVASAVSLGCQVVEVRPNDILSVAFGREVGAGK